MHKVVYNNCYGGFSLSLKAVDWLEENCKDEALCEHIKTIKTNDLSSGVSQKHIYLCYYVSNLFCDKRHHPDLVAVVEALGKEANGPCANLAIEEISGNRYRIDEYDGTEEVITPNGNDDWIFIND